VLERKKERERGGGERERIKRQKKRRKRNEVHKINLKNKVTRDLQSCSDVAHTFLCQTAEPCVIILKRTHQIK